MKYKVKSGDTKKRKVSESLAENLKRNHRIVDYSLDNLPDLIPVRMLNEFIYCPRLAYLEWIQGEFAESVDVVKGKFDHRVVDSPTESDRPVSKDDSESYSVESAYVSAPELGLVAVIDKVEIDHGNAVPVDYKHAAKPSVGYGVWKTDLVQICAHALILEENGFAVDYGVIYYVASRERIEVPIDNETREITLQAIQDLREMASSGKIPPPLDDSPKCPKCSLVGICLPDETDFLHHDDSEPVPEPAPRMILPKADESLPVYVQHQGFSIGKSKGVLKIRDRGKTVQDIPIHEINCLSVFGNIQISTQALQSLCNTGIPVCFFSHGGWFYGVTQGLGHKNVELRIVQHRGTEEQMIRLSIAQRLIADKILNCRTMLRRNATDVNQTDMRKLSSLASKALASESLDTLLGFEGSAAKIYFSNIHRMIKKKDKKNVPLFDFNGRNRRPPRDPVNALMSLAYSLLVKTWMVTLYTVGFDPFLGFYHSIRYGRPALALDMMEPFRPIVADSCVITAINTGIVKPDDFITRLSAASLKQTARAAFIQAFERRLSQTITHPVFGYKITYRQIFDVQARLLGRFLAGEIDKPPSFVTR
ncbi:CRISPR-associated endonuclease Cas1 [bacterium]|nr:CRISPR-associated endonuclease Cas1 [candidate division CSSED10-310 bacterium]